MAMNSLFADREKVQVPYPVVYVDSEKDLLAAAKELSSHREVAFDSEGVDLGRSGALTIATFGGMNSEDSPIYVVDVQELGGDAVFSMEADHSFRKILEDKHFPKLTFDCRSDSDALFHQFGVKMSGTIDLQVLDQAIRINNGETPPKRNPYLMGGSIPLLQNMDRIASRNGVSISKMPKPHVWSPKVWSSRPLSAKSIAYAANDVQVIRELGGKMRSAPLPPQLEQAVREHSCRYESMYRDRENELNRSREKDFIIEEHAIVAESDLPLNHPYLPRSGASRGEEKWDSAIRRLQWKDSNNKDSLFEDVLFVLQHDEWYTEDAFVYLRNLASVYPYFTAKQRSRIANPPKQSRYRYDDDDDDYGYDGYSGEQYDWDW